MKGSRGISLIEILVSLLIIALITGPFIGMFIQSTRVRLASSKQLNAIYTVRNEMEALMSKSSLEAYNSNGDKYINGLFIRTSIMPYSIRSNTQCFYVIAKTQNESEDEIIIYTPNGHKTILLRDDDQFYPIEINIDNSSFSINVDDQTIFGALNSSVKPNIQVNLTYKQSSNYLDFRITGDVEIKVYPGNDDNWSLSYDKEYSIVEKCSYRNYSILKAEIEAFDDANLNKSIFKIENIIRVQN